MKFTRDQYVQLMTFGPAPRPMFCELFGPLIGLEAEWRAQGATPAELDLTAFDFDWMPVVRCGVNLGPIGGGESVVLEETADYVIRRDTLGRRTKLIKRAATIALPLDFPVRTMDDWLRLRPMFQWRQDRINWTQVAAARSAQADGALVVGGMPGAYDLPRDLMGEEVACMAYHDQPELMHDILATVGESAERAYRALAGQLTLDQLSVHEDFAGKSGPLAGPRQVRDFFGPYYHRVWDVVAAGGTRLFDIDSDGNVNPVIEELLSAGINSMHPNEPAAGMDIVAIRHAFGLAAPRRLALKGGIDKHVLRQSQADIRRELDYKLQPLMRTGGTVFGLDHRIPNGTPLANYRYYVDTAREILGLPQRSNSGGGWGRMAF